MIPLKYDFWIHGAVVKAREARPQVRTCFRLPTYLPSATGMPSHIIELSVGIAAAEAAKTRGATTLKAMVKTNNENVRCVWLASVGRLPCAPLAHVLYICCGNRYFLAAFLQRLAQPAHQTQEVASS